MHWKSRQMFGGRPSGIVQMMGGGMTPYPTHTMPDGSVMRGAVHGQGYQDGGVFPELFEEGDSDINNALNNMASVSNPEVPDMPASNGMALPSGDMVAEELTMDQGPGDYSTAVRFLKRSFQDEIKEFVVQTPDQNEVQKYLAGVNRSYNQEVRKLKDQFNIDQSAPTEELLDDAFKQEIASMMNAESLPGMQDGGLVATIQTQADLIKWGIPYDITYWLTLPPGKKELILNRAQLERAYAGRTPAGKPLTRADLDTGSYDALTQERRENAKRMGAAARAKYSSTQSRLLHHDSAKKAGEATEAMAMDKLLADQIGDERGILSYLTQANTPGKGTTDSDRITPTADYQNAFLDLTDDKFDPTTRYNNAVKAALNNELGTETEQTVQIRFSDMGQVPPIQSFQGTRKIPDGPEMTWVEYFNARRAVMIETADFPERGTDEYYQKLVPIIYDWLDLAR